MNKKENKKVNNVSSITVIILTTDTLANNFFLLRMENKCQENEPYSIVLKLP